MISLLFFLSGFTGLLYEVLWAKYLALTLGSTALAQTAVLAFFMGGLALGYAFLGKKADISKNPLKLYGGLELGIAVLGFLSPFLLSGRAAVFSLLPPTVLMGGTLPALTRLAARELSEMQSAVAWFYFINSAGAVLGALAAGFYLIPVFGLDFSVRAAAGINLLIGISALALKLPARVKTAPKAEPSAEKAPLGPLLAVVFVSGFVSLGYEIAWTRLLALVLGSSTYSFSLMLASFISGIALGSFLVARGWHPKKSAYALLGWAEFGLAASILATLPLYDKLPWLALLIDRATPRSIGFFYLYEGAQLSMCFLLTLLPTIFLGMTLPLASRAAAQSKSRIASAVGLVFGMNTLGNVLGAAAAGLWLLPLLGLHGLIRAGVFLNLAAAAAVLWKGRDGKFIASLGLAVLIAIFSSPFDLTVLSNGPFRNSLKLQGLPSFGWGFLRAAVHKSGDLIFYKDGREATVSVFRKKDVTWLKVNGKTDASSVADMGTQVLQAHVPFLINPNAADILMIGLGGGVTAGSILKHPVARLDVAEISPEVVEGSRFFAAVNGEPMKDARLRLHLEDGKTFLRGSPDRYDVILSVPSNPWIAGIGNLFSKEFYADARGHLKPGGVMAQWFHLYEMSDGTLRMILHTFASEFPHAALWKTQGTDILLIGTASPQTFDFKRIEKEFRRPRVAADLSRIGVNRLTTLFSLPMGGAGSVAAIGEAGSLNQDRFPRLEYAAPKAFFLSRTSSLPYDFDERALPALSRGLPLEGYQAFRGRPLSNEEYLELAKFHGTSGNSFMLRLLSDWLRRFPGESRARFSLAQAQDDAGDGAAALATLRPLLRSPSVAAEAVQLGADLTSDPKEKLALLERLVRLKDADAARAYQDMAKLYETENYEKAVDCLGKAAAWAAGRGDLERANTLWMEAALAAVKRYDTDLALQCARKALDCRADDRIAQNMISGLLRVQALEREKPSP